MLLNHIGTGLAKSALVVLALLWAVGCSNGNDEDIAQKLGGGPTRQTATPTTTTDGEAAWTLQFCTDDFDQVWDIAAGRDGDLYLVGSTGGSFQGHQGQGDLDGFVARYDGDGDQVWVRQFRDWQI